MTVKQLRQALESFPEDAHVFVRATDETRDHLIIASVNRVSLQSECCAEEDDPPYVAIDADEGTEDAPPELPEPKTERTLRLVK